MAIIDYQKIESRDDRRFTLCRRVRIALLIFLIPVVCQLAWGILGVIFPVRGGVGPIGEDKLQIAWMNVKWGTLWAVLLITLFLLQLVWCRRKSI